jgi:hypothetical protein
MIKFRKMKVKSLRDKYNINKKEKVNLSKEIPKKI